jgi:acyl phosphate:glycerol-3-phosphate acyltransferase
VPVFSYLVAAVAAYLLGSIPTGFLVAKARGVDIRAVGSGNIGATNVFRAVGRGLGVLVLLGDALKGWLAAAVVAPLIVAVLPGAPTEGLRITAGVCAILGHDYTCWLGFRGGKGIAASAGVLIALAPLALLIVLGVFIVLFLTTRFVSVGSIGAAAVLPVATWFTTRDLGLTVVTGAMTALAIIKHRENIRRLLNGTEHRIQFGKREAAP